MLTSYLKTFFQNLKKHRLTTVINLAGLTIALACCIFIFLFVTDENSFDQFNTNKDRIFRYSEHYNENDETKVIIPACNFELITTGVAGFESGFRFMCSHEEVITIGRNKFVQDLCYADADILRVLSLPLMQGDSKTALAEPFTALLTEDAAAKYFGNPANAYCNTFSYKNTDYKITGILKNIPRNSHIRPEILISINTMLTTQPRLMSDWRISSCYLYFMARQGVSRQTLEDNIALRVSEKYGTEWSRSNRISLQPLTELYLHPLNTSWDTAAHGDYKTVRTFTIIAVLILLMAAFNYTNTLTAGVKIREKEISARKVLGAGTRHIFLQYFVESLLYLLFAAMMAMLTCLMLIDLFNDITGKQFAAGELLTINILLPMAAVINITAALSMAYPALLMAKAPLTQAMYSRASLNNSGHKTGFRQVVIGVQFTITTGLLICFTIIFSQINYALNSDPGFNRQHLVIIENPWDEKMHDRFDEFRTRLTRFPRIEAVSAAGNNPSENINNYTFIYPKGGVPKSAIGCGQIAVDYDLLRTWQAPIVKGRDFSRDIISDRENAVIINEAAAKALNLKDPLNTELNGVNNASDGQKIIGVVGDIHFKSLREKIQPLLLYIRDWSAANIVVRFRGDNSAELITLLKREWEKQMPDQPFKYKFIEDSMNKMYIAELRTRKLLIIFSIIAASISVMGLFSLITLISHSRKKEIGIRKTLGAGAGEIVIHITKEFLGIILAANLIAWPAAYFYTRGWLENFAYHIKPGWGMYIIPAAVVFVLSAAAISRQAFKAASENPVESLKYE